MERGAQRELLRTRLLGQRLSTYRKPMTFVAEATEARRSGVLPPVRKHWFQAQSDVVPTIETPRQ
jgi:hypothetical protein